MANACTFLQVGAENEEVDLGEDIFPSAPSDTLPLAALVQFPLSGFHPQLQSQLLQLPAEIRYQIWELATATYCDPRRPYDRDLHAWRPHATGPPRVDTSLLLTCRTIYLEAWDLPIRQAPLCIFHGFNDDRLPRETISLISLDMKPWQVLCLETIEVIFQQATPQDGLTLCIRDLENARSLALGKIEYYLQENIFNVRQAVVKDILRRSMREMVIRPNPRDWSIWESEPRPSNKENLGGTSPTD